jgi:hypothetical protein
VALGEGSRQAGDGVCVGDVQRLAAKLRTRRLDRCERLRDALWVAARQVDDIVLPEALGEALREREPEVARRPGHDRHTIHNLMYIKLFTPVCASSPSGSSSPSAIGFASPHRRISGRSPKTH